MELVFIYGPPAVGKYTVGKELAQLTGYKLLHNHSIIDMVNAVFEKEDNGPFWKIVSDHMERIVEAAAKYNVNLIMTYVYSPADDEGQLERFVNIVEKYNGEVLFVRLNAEKETLYERVENESRRAFGKPTNKTELDAALLRREPFCNVPYKNNLSIDNTNIEPKEVAAMINRHYNLKGNEKSWSKNT